MKLHITEVTGSATDKGGALLRVRATIEGGQQIELQMKLEVANALIAHLCAAGIHAALARGLKEGDPVPQARVRAAPATHARAGIGPTDLVHVELGFGLLTLGADLPEAEAHALWSGLQTAMTRGPTTRQ